MQIKDFKIAGSQLPDKSLLFWSCVVFQATKLKHINSHHIPNPTPATQAILVLHDTAAVAIITLLIRSIIKTS